MQRVLGYGLAAGLGLAACQNASFFTCSDDSTCVDGDVVGQCEPNGACSFPHDDCESGRRYGDNGDPELAGTCVDVGGTTGSVTTSTTGGADSDDGPLPGDATDGVGDDSGGSVCPEDWWDCTWLRRQRLSIAGVTETVTDVPVLVRLTDGRVDHDRIQNDGEDLRFILADGTVAPYEIASFDPEGVSRIWVHLSEVSPTSDHLWLYYDNVAAEGITDAASVWGDPYVGVWHLEAEPYVDSTASALEAIASGNIDEVPGQVGNAVDFRWSNPRLAVEPTPALEDIFANGGTASAWIRPRSDGGGGFGRIVQKGAGAVGWRFYMGDGGRLRFALDAIDAIWTTPEDALELHQWVHVAAVADFGAAVAPRLYINGVEAELDKPPKLAPDLPSDVDIPLTIGNATGEGRAFSGIIDEVHVQTQPRSRAWLALQYASMRDTLLTFGDIEAIEGVP